MAIFNRKSGTSQAGDTSSSETAEPGTPTHRRKLAGLRWRKSGRPSRNKISTPELKPNAVKFNPEMEPDMTTAGAVAQELRKLADALDKEPELEIFQPEIDFQTKYGGTGKKSVFLALARILPRPLKKATQKYDDTALELVHENSAIRIFAAIPRSEVCRLIEPAKTIPAVYDCTPLLSEEEENQLEGELK